MTARQGERFESRAIISKAHSAKEKTDSDELLKGMFCVSKVGGDGFKAYGATPEKALENFKNRRDPVLTGTGCFTGGRK